MINIDKELCIGCGMCCEDCPNNILEIGEDGKAAPITDKCLLCAHCVAICPQNAVTIDEYDMGEVIEYSEDFALDPDTLMRAMKFRRSIRKYRQRTVEPQKIEKIIEAGRFAPSATNSQNVSYIVVQNDLPALRKEGIRTLSRMFKMAQIAGKGSYDTSRMNVEEGDFLFKGAPAAILVISDNPINATLSSANMELMANSMGLGMLYVGFFAKAAAHNKKIQEMLGLTVGQQIATCLAVGYPDVQYQRTVPRRKPSIQWR